MFQESVIKRKSRQQLLSAPGVRRSCPKTGNWLVYSAGNENARGETSPTGANCHSTAVVQRSRRAGDQLGTGGRVPAREQRHLMAEIDQGLRQEMYDPLRTAVQLGRHALVQGGYLGDSQRSAPVVSGNVITTLSWGDRRQRFRGGACARPPRRQIEIGVRRVDGRLR